MKRWMMILLGICLSTWIWAQDEATPVDVPEKLDIYLLIGQSNMAGRAPFTKDEAGPIPRCFLFNEKDAWEPASIPLNRYSTIRKDLKMQRMNPGYTFATTMLEANPKVSIGLVVNAKGGTKIEQWKKGTPFYKEAIRRCKLAMGSGELKGILWHQGEGNAKDSTYLEKLTQLIADLRADLEAPTLPFIAGQVKDEPSILVNEQIAKLPETLPQTAFVSSDGLTTYDRWHFDAKSMRELGKRYAEQMLKLQAAD